jgi:tRNA pseudouridine38-40 synthase
MRIKIITEYDGTLFCGWQVQPNARSVQQEIELAVQKITGETVRVTGSGRTDSGVHAIGQVAHFDTASNIPPQNFYKALNTQLPADVRVLTSCEVDEDFHARYSAKEKTYEYKLYVSDVEKPTLSRYASRVEGFDIDKIKPTIDTIKGEHDFKCFCASGSEVESTIRTVYDLSARKEGDFIVIRITGNGFLYNTVRMIVGALKSVSDGKITVDDVKNALISGERIKGTATAEAKGLTLVEVKY